MHSCNPLQDGENDNWLGDDIQTSATFHWREVIEGLQVQMHRAANTATDPTKAAMCARKQYVLL